MNQPTVLQAEYPVLTWFRESVDEAVGEARHRLGLRNQPVIRVVNAEAVVDIVRRNPKLHRDSGGELVRGKFPVPLLTDHVYDSRACARPALVGNGKFRQRRVKGADPKQDQGPEEPAANAIGLFLDVLVLQ